MSASVACYHVNVMIQLHFYIINSYMCSLNNLEGILVLSVSFSALAYSLIHFYMILCAIFRNGGMSWVHTPD